MKGFDSLLPQRFSVTFAKSIDFTEAGAPMPVSSGPEIFLGLSFPINGVNSIALTQYSVVRTNWLIMMRHSDVVVMRVI